MGESVILKNIALKNYLVFVLVIFFGFDVHAQARNCIVDGVEPADTSGTITLTNYPVSDTTRVGEVFYGLDTQNVLGLTTGSVSRYATVAFENNRLIVSPLSDYERYEEENTDASFIITCMLTCEVGGSSLVVLTLTVVDTNNHDPHFMIEGDDTYRIGIPIATGFPVIPIYGGLQARDFDLTNHNITFDVSTNDYFAIEWLEYSTDANSKGIHSATVLAKQAIRSLPEPISILITITDNDETGDPRRTATKTLTIEAHPELQLPETPTFEKNYYTGDFQNNAITIEEIKLVEGITESLVFVTDSEYFSVSEINNGIINLTPLNTITDEVIENASHFLFSVTATNSESFGSTAIFLNIIKTPLEEMQFEQLSYSGFYYFHNNTLTIPNAILSTGYAIGTAFILSGENSNYFIMTETNGIVSITLNAELPESLLDVSHFIALVLRAERDGAESTYATINIALIKEPELLRFEETAYSGIYFIQNATLDIQDVMLSDHTTNNVIFGKAGNFHELFTITSQDNVVTIATNGDITNLLPQDTTFVSFTITADGENAISTFTTINVELRNDLVNLQFEETHYNGIYYVQDGTLQMPNAVLLEHSASEVTFEKTGNHHELFTITSQDNVVTIGINGDITDILPQDTSFVSFTLTANGENAVSTFTIINVELRNDLATLQFEETHYNGIYFIQNRILDIPDIILREHSVNEVIFGKSGNFHELFTITSQDNVVTIGINGDITDILPQDTSFVTFTITADGENAISTYTTINIELRNDLDTLAFDQNIYNGNYYVSNNSLDVQVITITEGYDINQVSLQLEEEYSALFRAVDNNGIITVETVENIADLIPNDVSLISITLTAQRIAATSASVVINIMVQRDTVILQFEETHYNGIYFIQNRTLEIPNALLLEHSANSVIFGKTGNYHELFTITSQDNVVTIATNGDITNLLPQDTSFVSFTLTADDENAISTFAIINVELRNDLVEETEINFQSPHYSGTYSADHVITLSSDILLQQADIDNTEVRVEVIGDEQFNEYFSVQWNGNFFQIDTTNLPDTTINDNTYVTLILEASYNDYQPAHTVVTLELPITESDDILQFEQSLYEGQYSFNTSTLSLPTITLTQGHNGNENFELSGANANLFNYEVEDNNIIISVIEGGIPDTVLEEMSLIPIILEATRVSAISATTVINIHLIPVTVEVTQLSFQSQHYSGTYSAEHVIILSSNVLLQQTDINNADVVIAVTGDEQFNEYFSVQWNGNFFQIDTTNLPDTTINDNTYVTLILEASYDNYQPAHTVVTLELPTTVETAQLNFQSPHYSGTYSAEHVITLSSNVLLQQTDINYADVTVAVIGEEQFNEYFSVQWNGNFFQIVTSNLPDTTINENTYVTLILEASYNDYQPAHTVVTLELPPTDSADILQFEHSLYEGQYSFNTATLSLPTITLTQGHNGNENFELSGAHANLFNYEVVDNNIIISVIEGSIPETVLEETNLIPIVLVATRVSAISATTVINIQLHSETDILLDALIVESIMENTGNNNMYNQEGCNLEILELYPEVPSSWFFIDSSTQSLAVNELIDREHELIAFMPQSQVQIRLSVNCNGLSNQRVTNTNGVNMNVGRVDSWNWIYTKPIEFKSNEQLITILVEDENDNSPIFTHEEPLVLGYPVADLAYVLRPQSLTTIEATDRDIDLNAEIMYTSNSNMFTIHPDTGVIYPLSNVFLQSVNSIDFVITATDQYGSGRSTDLRVQVQPLQENNVAVLKIENGMLENIDEILSNLSDQLGLKIKQISSTVLTNTETSVQDDDDDDDSGEENNESETSVMSKRDVSDENTILSIFVYALGSNDQLLESSVIKERVDEVTNIAWNIEGLELRESEFTNIVNTYSSADTLGLIIGISVLGGLLLCLLVGSIIIYFLYFRKNYRRFSSTSESSYASSSSGSSSSSNSNDQDTESVKSDSKNHHTNLIGEPNNNMFKPMNNEVLAANLTDIINPRYSGNNNLSQDISKTNNNKPTASTGQVFVEDEFGEKVEIRRKKSIVTFNEKVLQIEVPMEKYEIERL